MAETIGSFVRGWGKSWRRAARPAAPITRRAARAVACEPVERRVLFTAFTVTSLADTFANDGKVTLREAIQAANTDAAFDEAPAGSGADTISFDPALFAGGARTMTLAGQAMAITAPLTIAGPGQALLTLDANNSSRVFDVDDGTFAQIVVGLSGMTLARANMSSGSGGAVYSAENLTVQGCTVRNSTAASPSFGDGPHPGGGGIYSNHAPLTLVDCTIQNNSATSAGFGGGVNCAWGVLNATGCNISGNTSAQAGGGVDCGSSGSATLTNCTIANNQSARYGGGGGGVDSAGFAITGCTITGNYGENGGGVFSNAQNGAATVSQSTIANNTSAEDGGGLYTEFNSVSLTDSTIANNTSGLSATLDGGGGIITFGPLTVTRCNLSGNACGGTTSGNGGGAIYAASSASITDSTLSGNKAKTAAGGALYAKVGATLTGDTISGNTAGREGGGVYFASASGATRTVTHATIASNAADKGGGLYSASGTFTLRGTIIGDNAATTSNPDAAVTATGDYNLIENATGAFVVGSNNVTGVDALLAPLGNYGGPTQTQALRPGSPAIDAAVANGLTADSRGAPRTVEYATVDYPSVPDAPSGDGTDIGAVEASPPAAASGAFRYAAAPYQVAITFNGGASAGKVSGALAASSLTVRNVATNAAVTVATVAYDPTTDTATFTFAAGVVPDGNYRATLPAAAVTDAAGNKAAADYTLDFYVLAGDVNRDRRVDIADFAAMQNHFSQAGAYADGDVNGDGQVNIADFAMLQNNFNASLAPPAAAPAAASRPAAAAAPRSAAPVVLKRRGPHPTRRLVR